MEKLSIWNDFTTIKQRYLNVLHGMTRIDEHPRQINQGKHMNQAILKRLELLPIQNLKFKFIIP